MYLHIKKGTGIAPYLGNPVSITITNILQQRDYFFLSEIQYT